jgi:hypothetical protein
MTDFNPAVEAIIEKELGQTVGKPDTTFSQLTEFTPNQIKFEVYTDRPALFVISESWYPPGWKIFIDEKEVSEVYKTNHSMQSVVVPAGNHKIELKFEPDSFYTNLTVASISVGIIYLTILLSLGMVLKERKVLFFKTNSPSK